MCSFFDPEKSINFLVARQTTNRISGNDDLLNHRNDIDMHLCVVSTDPDFRSARLSIAMFIQDQPTPFHSGTDTSPYNRRILSDPATEYHSTCPTQNSQIGPDLFFHPITEHLHRQCSIC